MASQLRLLATLVLWFAPGAMSQSTSVDPMSAFVSQAFSVFTQVKSVLSVEATKSSAPTTSASTTSSSSSTTSSTSSSIFATSTTSSSASSTPITSSAQSASNTAEAAAASSSAAAAVAAARAQVNKNRITAIALGVVLGLLGLATLLGLLLFCLRRRRRRQATRSPRSLSSESVDGATWRKGHKAKAAHAGNSTGSHLSTNERHHAPEAAAAPLMTENSANRHDGHGALGNRTPVLNRGVPKFEPGVTDVGTASHGHYPWSPNHVHPNSHSRSDVAAAGLGGAALGALAAKHHSGTHGERDFASHPDGHHSGVTRQSVGDSFGNGTAERPSSTGVPPSTGPGHSAGDAGSYNVDDSAPLGTNGNHSGTNSDSTLGHGSPPAYNGDAASLSSHPPFQGEQSRNSGHEPLMAGAAGIGAGALVGAATAKNHDQDRLSDSSLLGRRSWDPSRQPQHPQSILANGAGRRISGSTNPYVPARSPRKARFSNGVLDTDDRSRRGSIHQEDLNESPRLISPISDDGFPRQGSPRNSMPGGWRGSGEWDGNGNGHRSSFSNDRPISQLADSRPRNASLSDLQKQEEHGWYRGRFELPKPTDPGRPGNDSRFYSNHAVGQAY